VVFFLLTSFSKLFTLFILTVHTFSRYPNPNQACLLLPRRLFIDFIYSPVYTDSALIWSVTCPPQHHQYPPFSRWQVVRDEIWFTVFPNFKEALNLGR
jgi:hypothetical protein